MVELKGTSLETSKHVTNEQPLTARCVDVNKLFSSSRVRNCKSCFRGKLFAIGRTDCNVQDPVVVLGNFEWYISFIIFGLYLNTDNIGQVSFGARLHTLKFAFLRVVLQNVATWQIHQFKSNAYNIVSLFRASAEIAIRAIGVLFTDGFRVVVDNCT